VLRALNEVYVGHASHQSARYLIEPPDGGRERQSSSGLLAGTGTGSTGWLGSCWQERHSTLNLPGPTEPRLCWFVREAWPSPATGTSLTEGTLASGQELTVVAESDRLVCFGDGIESDALTLTWGQRLTIRAAARGLHLVPSGRHAAAGRDEVRRSRPSRSGTRQRPGPKKPGPGDLEERRQGLGEQLATFSAAKGGG
jgi:hypothetical protein